MAQSAKILDHRFRSDILSNFALVRKYVELPSNQDSSNVDLNYKVLYASGSNFMRQLPEEDSTNDRFDDQSICFYQNVLSGDRRNDTYSW